MRGDTTTPDRLIALEGGRNFRDLGGYPAADGRRVKWGVLFRSGSLAGLTQADWDGLCARGVRTICDLRTLSEREAEPFGWMDHAGLTYRAHDYRLSFADLTATLKAGFPTGEAARAGMMAGYRDLPVQLAPAYRQLFAHLAANDVPLIFHCAAGKDRAGTAAALILTALGVPREIVVEDYALTNIIYDVEAMLRRPRTGHLERYAEDVGAAVARADPDYIAAALDGIDARHGGVAGYLDSVLGIKGDDLEAIRDQLLEG